MSKKQLMRIKRVVIVTTLFIASGIIYGLIVSFTHRGIPCILHELTGLRCPGCGMTHAMVSLLHLDIRGFISANIMAPFIILFIAWVYIYTSIKYIRTGVYRLGAGNTAVEIAFLCLFVIWTLSRNFIGL